MAGVPLPFPRGLGAGINRGTDVNKRFALSYLGNTLSNGAFGGAPFTKGITQEIKKKFGSHERESGPFFFVCIERCSDEYFSFSLRCHGVGRCSGCDPVVHVERL